jgi:hypothetical protein
VKFVRRGTEILCKKWIAKNAPNSEGKCEKKDHKIIYKGKLIINKNLKNLSFEDSGFSKIEGSLDIRNTKIEELPGNLFNVCGVLRIDYTPLAKRVLNNDLKERENELINKTTVWMF